MSQTETADKLNAAGMKALAAGNRPAAERLFLSAVARGGGDISAYMNLAFCFLSGKVWNRTLYVLAAMRGNCNPSQLAAAAVEIKKLEEAASRGIKERFLLVSLGETFESRLFVAACAESWKQGHGTLLDLAMPRRKWFANLEPPEFSFGRRLPAGETGWPAEAELKGYDGIVFVDFPETAALDRFCGLLALEGPRKVFVSLRLACGKGVSAAADLADYRKLFRSLDAMFMLENDSAASNTRYGVPASRLVRYRFSVNTDYYSPLPGGCRPYLFSAGTAARNYPALLEAMRGMDIKLRIRTDLDLKALNPGGVDLSVSGLTGSYEQLRPELGAALAVIIPFRPELNQVSNSILTMAMSMGKVVLINRTPYLSKIVKDGVNGFLYDENLPGDLRKKILGLLSLTDSRRRLIGARARRTVLAGADYRIVAQKAAAALRGKRPR